MKHLETVYFEGNPIHSDVQYRLKLKLALPSLKQIDATFIRPSWRGDPGLWYSRWHWNVAKRLFMRATNKITWNDNSVAFAPGKVLIAGGYLVLDRAHCGAVLTVNTHFKTVVRSTETRQTNRFQWTIRSPQFNDPVRVYVQCDQSGGCALSAERYVLCSTRSFKSQKAWGFHQKSLHWHNHESNCHVYPRAPCWPNAKGRRCGCWDLCWQ